MSTEPKCYCKPWTLTKFSASICSSWYQRDCRRPLFRVT